MPANITPTDDETAELVAVSGQEPAQFPEGRAQRESTAAQVAKKPKE
jgi:hypothetical protein